MLHPGWFDMEWPTYNLQYVHFIKSDVTEEIL